MRKSAFYLKILCIFLLVLYWIWTIVVFRGLPAVIPIHFGADGHANDFGPRATIWFLPVICTVFYGIFSAVSKNPSSPLLSVPDAMRRPEVLKVFLFGTLSGIIALLFAIDYTVVFPGENASLPPIFFVIFALLLGFMIGFIFYFAKTKEPKF